MNIFQFIYLFSDGLIRFVITALLIACFLPMCLLPIYGYALVFIVVAGLVCTVVSLFIE